VLLLSQTDSFPYRKAFVLWVLGLVIRLSRFDSCASWRVSIWEINEGRRVFISVCENSCWLGVWL